MSKHSRQQALDALDQVIAIRAETARALRVAARAARKAGNQGRASALSSQAIRLNQQNFRILHARRKLRTAVSVGPALARMRAIAGDAAQVEADIRKGADLLGAAASLVRIITRLSGLFL